MFSHCDYCKEKFEWTGKEYHHLTRDGFCSAECGNSYNLANNTPFRFCTNSACGSGFYSKDVTTGKRAFFCDNCQTE
jgi:hypothetical protein